MIFNLPRGWAYNGHWCGVGARRYKDGEVWWVQIWHPEHHGILFSNKGIITRRLIVGHKAVAR